MSNVFISGVAGFMGSALAAALSRRTHVVVGDDNLVGGSRRNIAANASFHHGDTGDLEMVTTLMKGVDVAYLMAASPHEGLSTFSPCLITRNTYMTAVVGCTAAIRCGVKRIVFTSSMARYGGQHYPFDEEMEPRPVDPYGIAKVAAEKTLRVLCQTHGVELVVAVPHNVIGPGQKYDDPFRNVVAIMMNRMLQGKQPIIYGDGEQRRCFSHINDVVGPLVEMGFRADLDGAVINVGPDEEFVTINELARLVAVAMDFAPLEPVYISSGRPLEVKSAYCTAHKARALLGYKTTYTLSSALADMAAWIKSMGPKEFNYHLPIELADSPVLPRTWKERVI